MKTSHLQKTVEIEKEPFELMKGKFSPEDALEIISSLIQRKIDYHSLRSFSHHERFGVNDQWSEARIRELTKSLESIQMMITKAQMQGNYLYVKSSIAIEVVPS